MRKRERNRQRVRRHQRQDRGGHVLERRIEEAAHAWMATLLDPAIPPEVAATELVATLNGGVVPPSLIEAMAEASAGRPREVAAAALARGVGVTELSLAAGAAVQELRFDDAAVHLGQALELSDHPLLRFQMATVSVDRGDLIGGLERLDDLLCEGPEMEHAQALRSGILEEFVEAMRSPSKECPCGSRRAFEECCLEQAGAAVERFRDRQPVYALREAVTGHVKATPELASFVDDAVGEWIELLVRDDGGERAVDEEDLVAHPLLVERAWQLPLDDEDDEHPDECLLDRFAADPSTPEASARRARDWAAKARWGLWQVERPVADPGVLLVDCVTGLLMHAEIADEQLGMPRWSVLLGTLIPVDGVWRSGSALLQLTPEEGRALALQVLDMVRAVARRGGPEAREAVRWATRARGALRGRTPRTPQQLPPAPSGIETLVSHVILLGLPQLLATVSAWRRAGPAIRNTDGNRILLVEATLEVDDVAGLRRALAAHPDFTPDEEEGPGGFTWWGRDMTGLEREGMLSQARALAEQHGAPLDDALTGRRWVRGWLHCADGSVRVRVNSRERFDRLLHQLGDLGHPARVVDERVIDPRHLAGGGQGVPAGSIAGPVDATTSGPGDARWRRAWMDEPLPALDGVTPRVAASSEAGRERLEALLRVMEYQADVMGDGDDAAHLREELGLTRTY